MFVRVCACVCVYYNIIRRPAAVQVGTYELTTRRCIPGGTWTYTQTTHNIRMRAYARAHAHTPNKSAPCAASSNW